MRPKWYELLQRSTGHHCRRLLKPTTYLEEEKVGLLSLQGATDTTPHRASSPSHLFGALAEFERNLIRERTQAGLAAARSRGRKGGRPTALNEDKRASAVRLYHENAMPIARICTMLGISKLTLYSYVRADEAAERAAWE